MPVNLDISTCPLAPVSSFSFVSTMRISPTEADRVFDDDSSFSIQRERKDSFVEMNANSSFTEGSFNSSCRISIDDASSLSRSFTTDTNCSKFWA